MTTDAVGGVWTYSLALARGLCSEGWSVTLAVLGPSPDVAQRQDVAAIDGCTLMIADLTLDWTANGDEAVAQAGQTIAELAAECDANRSEERRVGKECVRTGRYRGARDP